MWLQAAIRRNAARAPGALALRDSRRDVNCAELERDVLGLAAYIAEHVPREGRVAISSDNRVEVLEAYAACAAAGAIAVPVNSSLADPELEYILDYVEPTLAIGQHTVLPRLKQAREALQLLPIDDVPAMGASSPRPRLDASLDDPFALLHTSATTGHPKGALTDMRALQLNSLSFAADVHPRPGLVYLHATPLFHGSMVIALGYVAAGATVALLDRFTPQGFVRAAGDWRAEHALLVPSMIRLLLQALARRDADLGALRLIMHTGEPMPPDLRDAASERLAVPLRNVYGITEGGGPVMTFGDEDARQDPAIRGATCAGVPLLGYEVEILREDATPADVGEVGEICVRSDGVMREYWRRPDATAETLRGGRLHTGDLGYRDERGYVWVVDRRSDLILRGGQNVYPAEIERVLRRSDCVADVAVVAAPSESWGQTPWAFVQPTQPEDFDEQELLALAVRELASYKRPSRFIAVDSIPRGPSGKALRRELRLEVDAIRERELQVTGRGETR